MEYVTDALARLEGMAAVGKLPGEVACEAEAIAAGWWWNEHGDLTPARAAGAGAAALVRDRGRALRAPVGPPEPDGRPRDAEDAARWAVALDEAQQVLRAYT